MQTLNRAQVDTSWTCRRRGCTWARPACVSSSSAGRSRGCCREARPRAGARGSNCSRALLLEMCPESPKRGTESVGNLRLVLSILVGESSNLSEMVGIQISDSVQTVFQGCHPNLSILLTPAGQVSIYDYEFLWHSSKQQYCSNMNERKEKNHYCCTIMLGVYFYLCIYSVDRGI